MATSPTTSPKPTPLERISSLLSTAATEAEQLRDAAQADLDAEPDDTSVKAEFLTEQVETLDALISAIEEAQDALTNCSSDTNR